ncbi:MAG: ATP-binding protein, partial [Bacteroidota bacterium]
QQNGHAWMEVGDEGPGISAEDQQKMFRKFQKLTARPTGGESSNGLGLAIVKTLAERLDGTIELDSDLGKGARFRVRLSRQLQQEAAARAIPVAVRD